MTATCSTTTWASGLFSWTEPGSGSLGALTMWLQSKVIPAASHYLHPRPFTQRWRNMTPQSPAVVVQKNGKGRMCSKNSNIEMNLYFLTQAQCYLNKHKHTKSEKAFPQHSGWVLQGWRGVAAWLLDLGGVQWSITSHILSSLTGKGTIGRLYLKMNMATSCLTVAFCVYHSHRSPRLWSLTTASWWGLTLELGPTQHVFSRTVEHLEVSSVTALWRAICS